MTGSPTRVVRMVRAGLVLIFAALASGCASGAELDTLKPQGPIARSIDTRSDPVFLIAGIVFLIIFGGTAVIWWRFKSN